ncbi:hypothetical protein FH972_026799 [Carpinus fangiana]|uniref:Uncharacterized protein n=1 Tax=Carpinus fangiana TaxID=176857 RepID=A0A5N6L531_9ROSI|nr:hypothetical protein FH972_026794 [Carpinus fangiana]KAB8903398.1 hypothetical protein FH972_026799 [Carpinus fangiana]
MGISSEATASSRSTPISQSQPSTHLSITFYGLLFILFHPLASALARHLTLCVEFCKDPGANSMSLSFSSCRKRKSQNRQDTTLSVAETLAKWEEHNAQMESCNNKKKTARKAPGIGSKKGCMKGKGGPENSSYISIKIVFPNLRNEDEEDEWSSNTLNAAVTKADVDTPNSTQQVEEGNDEWCNIEQESSGFWDLGQEYSTNEMWSSEEIDALLERNPIHDIESVLGHDASQFWFSAVESMNDMAADAFLNF